MNKSGPIYLIDGGTYIYRAYHALPPLTNSNGLPTNAVLGFINILLRVIREVKPSYLAVAFDPNGPTFRNDMYKEYKANHPSKPEDMLSQIPYIKDVVKGYNITILEESGFEADDLIASAARRLSKDGHEVVVVTGDKDLLQLVDEKTSLWDPMYNRRFDPAAVKVKYGVEVTELLDYFSMVGDKADNIPGVPGIGPKTAEKLINTYGSLDNLYDKLAEIDNKNLAEKLKNHSEMAFLSRDLIRLKEDLAIPIGLADYLLTKPDNDRLREIYTLLGFTKLLRKCETLF